MRTCRVCGCTDDAACTVLDVPCCWIEADLCSACATLEQLLASEEAGVPWLYSVMGEHAGRTLMQAGKSPFGAGKSHVLKIWREVPCRN